jgi:hypothetical protein
MIHPKEGRTQVLVPVSQGNAVVKQEEPLPEVLDERSVSNEGVKVVDVSSLVAMF